jgi:hypothetical protein
MKEERTYYICNFLTSLKSTYIVLIYNTDNHFHFLKRTIIFEREDGFFDFEGIQYTIQKKEAFLLTQEEITSEYGINSAKLIIEETANSLSKENERIIQNRNISLNEISENSFLIKMKEKKHRPLDWFLEREYSQELKAKILLVNSITLNKSEIQ